MTFLIVVNYNFSNIDKFLSQICVDKEFNTILVDNSEVKAVLAKNYPNLYRINNDHNLGFARACNRGIKQALSKGAKYVILINPDIEITISKLKKISNCSADICSPIIKTRNNKGKTTYDLGGKVFKEIGRAYHVTPTEANGEIDYVSGACMRIKSHVFKRIGYLDEDFFMYYEDVDFCLRAKKVGLSVEISKNVMVSHELSGIIGQNSWKKHLYNLKSNLTFIMKNTKLRYKPIALTYWAILVSWVSIKFCVNKIVK
jgi:GT2 family glycosyltransferase